MAEQERLTKKERRERARAERKAKEAEAAKKRQRQRLMTYLTTAIVVAAIAAVVYAAVGGGSPSLDEAITVSASAVEDGRAEAGCEILATEPLPDRTHYDPATAPSPDQLYGEIRPTHSGAHYASSHPIVPFSDTQLEERALTHNLEHGAILAWYDPEKVESADIRDMQTWAEQLDDAGFAARGGGGAIIVSPYEDPGISSGKAIALRAWGLAMDCDAWNQDVANGFVIDSYGTHGIAPERNLSPYPEGVLAYSDREVGDNTEAPSGGASPMGSEAPSETQGSPSAGSESPSDGGGGTSSPAPSETASS